MPEQPGKRSVDARQDGPGRCLVAIAGGSGSGKSWLAEELLKRLPAARCLALDDFYRDRAYLSPKERERVNYDHPRAIDWKRLKGVLKQCLRGRPVTVPVYDFASHSRRPAGRRVGGARIWILEGLWAWRRRDLRTLFGLRVFVDCPARVRRERRVQRDVRSRGRTRASVERQFRRTVEPMHRRYVAPQSRWADIVIDGRSGVEDVEKLARRIKEVAATSRAAVDFRRKPGK